ncbi:MAG: hypothetical protein U0746_03195 [Gemmataceae bacterium]
MVETSRALGFPFLAAVAPRHLADAAVDLPYGRRCAEEMVCVAPGAGQLRLHALEVLQCMAESRRKGGETGAGWPSGPARRGGVGVMAAGGWDAALFEACLCRSQTPAQPETFSHRYPSAAQMEQVKDPVAYRINYADGLEGDDKQDERAGRRFHVRGPAEGSMPSRSRRCSTCRRTQMRPTSAG